MIGEDQQALLDGAFRIARDSAIDALTSFLLAHPHPDVARSDSETRRLAEGAIVGLHGMFVREVAVPMFVEGVGRYLFGITDGSESTLIDLLTHLGTNLRSTIPPQLREECEERVMRLFMGVMLGWVSRREQAEESGRRQDPANHVANAGAILEAAVDQAPIGVYVIDHESAEPIINNPAHQQMFGYSAEEELTLEPEQFQDDQVADDDFELLADLLDGRIPYLERISTRPHKDGQSVPYHLFSWPVRREDGAITHLVNLISPAERSGATSGSGLAEKRARFLLRLSPDPILITTAAGEIRYASPSVGSAFGHDPDSLIGVTIEHLFAPSSRKIGRRMMAEVVRSGLHRVVREIEVSLRDGERRWFEIVATNLLFVEDVQGIVLQGRDVTERREMREELERTARTDALSGLLNRRGFIERLQTWLERHAAADPRRASVACYVDLDAFKAVNDHHGHETGDAVLATIGQRLALLVEGRGFAGRIGGDEFVLLVELADDTEGERFRGDLALALTGAIMHHGQMIPFAGSAGIVTLRDPVMLDRDAAQVLRAADAHLAIIKNGRPHRLAEENRG